MIPFESSRMHTKSYSRSLAILSILISTTFCYGSLTKEQQLLLPQGLENYHLTRPEATVNGEKHSWPLISPTASVDFDLHGERLTLDLVRNDGLLDSTFHHAYQVNGQMKRRQGTAQPFCYYHGRIRQFGKELVRPTTCVLMQ